ncbi:MAG: putative 2OG-Fe(II) oxygenase [Hyphomonas sp.]
MLWESWLRHEVMASASDEARISVSFNYAVRRK